MRATLALVVLAACGYPEPSQVFRDSGIGADSPRDGAIDTAVDASGASALSDAVWISNYGQENSSPSTIMKVSKSTNTVTQTVNIGSTPIFVGVDLDSVWVANDSRHALMASVMRIDKATNAVTQTIPTGNGDQTKSPAGLAVDATDVWVVVHNALTTASAHLLQISKATNAIVNDIALDGSTPNFPDGNSLAIDNTYVWIVGYFSGNVLRVTKSNGAMMTFNIGGGSRFGIAVGSEAVWVTGGSPANIKRINKSDGTITTISGTGFTPGEIAIDATTLWVNSTTGGVDQLFPVDRVAGTIGQPITLASGCGAYAIALDASSVYVTCPDGSPGSNRYIERIDKTTKQVTPITVGVFPLSLGDTTGFAYDHLAP
jgi:hypothetical protein